MTLEKGDPFSGIKGGMPGVGLSPCFFIVFLGYFWSVWKTSGFIGVKNGACRVRGNALTQKLGFSNCGFNQKLGLIRIALFFIVGFTVFTGLRGL